MSQVTASQVEKVRRYSVYARAACSLLLLVLAATAVFLAYTVLSGPGTSNAKFYVGNATISADQVSGAGIKAWMLTLLAIGVALSAVIIYLLRRMFDNMARGEIFSAQNVMHLRRLAIIILAIGVLQIVMPWINGILHATGVFEPAHVVLTSGVQFPGMLTPFGVGLLIYLASWIMQVGLGVSDEAAELRREAELVV